MIDCQGKFIHRISTNRKILMKKVILKKEDILHFQILTSLSDSDLRVKTVLGF